MGSPSASYETVAGDIVLADAYITGPKGSPESSIKISVNGRPVWEGLVVGVVSAVHALPHAGSCATFAASVQPTRLPWSGVFSSRGGSYATQLILEVSKHAGAWDASIGHALRDTLASGIDDSGAFLVAVNREGGERPPSSVQSYAWRLREPPNSSTYLFAFHAAEENVGSEHHNGNTTTEQHAGNEMAAERLREALCSRADAVTAACAAKEELVAEKMGLLEHVAKLLVVRNAGGKEGSAGKPPPFFTDTTTGNVFPKPLAGAPLHFT